MRSGDMTQALLQDRADIAYARDLGRAFGGALLFGLPLLMTMEMWNYGLTLDGTRLAIFFLSALSLLFGLAHFAGFTPSRSLGLAALEVFAALAVGFISVCILLALFGVLEDAASPRIRASQVALQVVPAAMGACSHDDSSGRIGPVRTKAKRAIPASCSSWWPVPTYWP